MLNFVFLFETKFKLREEKSESLSFTFLTEGLCYELCHNGILGVILGPKEAKAKHIAHPCRTDLLKRKQAQICAEGCEGKLLYIIPT